MDFLGGFINIFQISSQITIRAVVQFFSPHSSGIDTESLVCRISEVDIEENRQLSKLDGH